MEHANQAAATVRYPGIDGFRLAAAFMIVAIHTAPFASVSQTADYLFTYVFCRIGVPFFFMVTGYFVLSPALFEHNASNGRLWYHLQKMGLLYGISVLLYLPIMAYAGQLSQLNTVGAILKAILVDGTFYHLWYLPASITGILVLIVLARLSGRKWGIPALAVTLLYLIGLGGDTYYGLISQNGYAESFYNSIFTFSSYTRNGFFFAPAFLLLGAAVRQTKHRFSPRVCAAGFAGTLAVMLLEGWLTYGLGWQRHNSMYLALPAVMLFFFEGLLYIRGKALPVLPPVSMWIYILHPICIIAVRGAAKVLGMTKLLVENSLVHYLAVCALSLIASVAAEFAVRRAASLLPPPQKHT